MADRRQRPTGSPPKPPSLQERTVTAQERTADLLGELRDVMVGRDRRERESEDSIDRQLHAARPRREPRKPMWGMEMFRNWPEILTAFERRVPANFVAMDRGGVEVACPCGLTPHVTAGNVRVCECERAYFYDDREVRVAFSPLDAAPPVEEAETPAGP